MSALLWLSDDAWAAIAPHLPNNQPGARRVDGRHVISGILHVLKTCYRWKDCPADYGPPTTIYNRFNRWSHRQLWSRILDALVARGVLALSASIDSSYVKAHRSAHGGNGAKAQAIGPSRGVQTTKIHAVTDLLGRAAILRLTAGNVADVTMAGPLMDAAGRVHCLIADKGYDANVLRKRLHPEGAKVVIPGRSNRKVPIDYDNIRYKDRWRIEAAFL